MTPLKLTENELATVTLMLENYYARSLERLEVLSTHNTETWAMHRIYVSIEARVIATYLLEIWLVQKTDDYLDKQKPDLTIKK